MAVASWRVMGWLPTSIFSAEAPFAYVGRALLLAEIHVPFVRRTEARKAGLSVAEIATEVPARVRDRGACCRPARTTLPHGLAPQSYARRASITSACVTPTSVKLSSRPSWRAVKRVWSSPSAPRSVAWRSGTRTTSFTAR